MGKGNKVLICIRFGCVCMLIGLAMKKNKSQVVRVPLESTERLNEIAEKVGVSQAQLVRWAVDALIADVERRGGKLVLPYGCSERGAGGEFERTP